MSVISYNNVLALGLLADIHALSVLSSGEVVKTTDPVQADEYEAQCERLFQADVELLVRYQRGKERDSEGVVWHTFEGRLHGIAIGYLAQLAEERLALSREPLPPPQE